MLNTDLGGSTYFVKSKHLASHLSAVVERDAHTIVDQILHLALLVSHIGGVALKATCRCVQRM